MKLLMVALFTGLIASGAAASTQIPDCWSDSQAYVIGQYLVTVEKASMTKGSYDILLDSLFDPLFKVTMSMNQASGEGYFINVDTVDAYNRYPTTDAKRAAAENLISQIMVLPGVQVQCNRIMRPALNFPGPLLSKPLRNE